MDLVHSYNIGSRWYVSLQGHFMGFQKISAFKTLPKQVCSTVQELDSIRSSNPKCKNGKWQVPGPKEMLDPA
jgi:hypothetical protein